MKPGTRVIHRRYAWIGTVINNPVLGIVTVQWEKHHGARDEYMTDVRATPVQTTEN